MNKSFQWFSVLFWVYGGGWRKIIYNFVYTHVTFLHLQIYVNSQVLGIPLFRELFKILRKKYRQIFYEFYYGFLEFPWGYNML